MKVKNLHKRSMNWSAKLLTTLIIASSISTVQVAAKSVNHSGLAKQLDILNGIFQTSLQGQNKPVKAKVTSLYLAGQGAVFTIKSANSFAWEAHGFSFVFPEGIAPVAPVAPMGGNIEFEYFSEDDEVDIQIEHQQEAHENRREAYQDMREQQRDIRYEIRDLQRESKDLAYQLESIDEDNKAQVIIKQKKVIKQQKALKKAKQSLTEKSKQMQQVHKKQQVQRLKARKAQYQQLSSSLIETLCLYGNSLKALPKGEHVSLIVKHSGEKVGRNYKDTIFVFDKKSIKDCANDNVTMKKFTASANSYQF